MRANRCQREQCAACSRQTCALLLGLFTLALGTLMAVEVFSISKLLVVMLRCAWANPAKSPGRILTALTRVSRCTLPNQGSGGLSVTGVALVSVSDSRHGATDDGVDKVTGDLLALSGAFMYGAYTTLLKKKIGHEDRIDMRVFFGTAARSNGQPPADPRALRLNGRVDVRHWPVTHTPPWPGSGGTAGGYGRVCGGLQHSVAVARPAGAALHRSGAL